MAHKDPEVRKEYQKKYEAENADKIKQKQREYYEKNKEKRREYAKEYSRARYQAMKEVIGDKKLIVTIDKPVSE